ncbi:MAG: hypothetical protein EBX50_16085 [Chitinophagia bacterium]|nr:hypothetical protein [Chitinophagia bacterium]
MNIRDHACQDVLPFVDNGEQIIMITTFTFDDAYNIASPLPINFLFTETAAEVTKSQTLAAMYCTINAALDADRDVYVSFSNGTREISANMTSSDRKRPLDITEHIETDIAERTREFFVGITDAVNTGDNLYRPITFKMLIPKANYLALIA